MQSYIVKNKKLFSFSKEVEAENPEQLLRKYIEEKNILKIKHLQFKTKGSKNFETLLKVSSKEIVGKGLWGLTIKEYLTIFTQNLEPSNWNNIDWNAKLDGRHNVIKKLEPIVKQQELNKFLIEIEKHIPSSLKGLLSIQKNPFTKATHYKFLPGNTSNSKQIIGIFYLENSGNYITDTKVEKFIVVFKHYNKKLTAAKYQSWLSRGDYW